MGAHTFQTSVMGKLTPKEAYDELVEEALYESGHDPYNGTISTTQGIVIVEAGGRRINTIIEEILEDEDSEICKWGPAGCIELKGTALRKFRSRSQWSAYKGKRGIRAYVFFGWAAE